MKTGTLRSKCRRGATLVELSAVLLITITIIFAIYDYCRYFMLAQLVNNAAREGARQAVVSTNLQDTSTIQALVVQYLAGQNLTDSSGKAFSASDVQIYQVVSSTGAKASDSNWYDSAFGSSIQVQVNAYFTPFFPTLGFLPKSVPLVGTAMMSSEAN